MNRRWVRILLALFIGGALSETVRLSTGKENGGLVFLGAIISYVLISGIIYYRNLYMLQREVDRKARKKRNSDLLDN